MEPLLALPGPAAAGAGPDPRPGAATRGRPSADADAADRIEPDDGWAGAVIVADARPRGRRSASAARSASATSRSSRCCCSCPGAQLGDLELRDDLFDDFCLAPVPPPRARGPAQAPVLAQRTAAPGPSSSSTATLVLNLETYQAAIARRPLDLTYMEYELLKFLASHPGKVFTRETLLSRVWGYEYYGGARTVDVHIRRLRAKLGEEHANLIQTVRSVGYRFGQSRWGV